MNSEEIRTIREDLALTQTVFAQLLGVHPLTVSKWERGIAAPTDYQLALLESFRDAHQNKPEIGEVVRKLLIGAGIGLALYYLLKAAHGDE